MNGIHWTNQYDRKSKLSRPVSARYDRPNIVLIMTDQHAARVLGVAGDSAAQTPALDQLAANGTVYSNAYCPSPLCVPSRMAFLTGLEPHRSGVLTNDDFLPPDVPTIAHSLGAAGYDCRLVGRMHFYGPDQLHGFASRPIGDIGPGWPGAGAPEIGPLTNARGNHGSQVGGSGRGETSYQAYDAAVADCGVETIEKLVRNRDATGRPFFALVSLFCPHPPYIALPDDYDAVSDAVRPPELEAPQKRHPAIAEWAEAGAVALIDDDEVQRARTAYYGLVRMVDRLAGQIVSAVAGRDDTVVIYTSDHGEALGERGLWWKSTFYEESAKVPLIIAGPGIARGHVDHRVTSLFDLSATILDLSDAPGLPGQVGRSLLTGGRWDDRAFSSYYGGLMNIKSKTLQHRMLRRGAHKLCVYNGHLPQLFDLANDPNELSDIAGQRPKLVSQLLEELMAGWDPIAIADMQARTVERTALIRLWVKAARPEEPYRWKDRKPERNRYL
ncbi:MAG: sulfatase-like hydrolase/transferase [Paracoccaceae bacterium]